jgi:hemolysin III
MSNNTLELQTEVASRAYSLAEEVLNSLTHGIGAALSIVGMTLLLAFAGLDADFWKLTSFAIYGVSLTLLYLSSTLYHGFHDPMLKRAFKIVDHCAIYLLIAGTYTPFLLVNLRGSVGWTLFAVIWGLALAGICFKLLFGSRYRILSVSTYLLMGWLIVFASTEMVASIERGGILLLAAGGITYSLGVIFYLWKRLPYSHPIWHLFVLGGSICHYLAIFYYVLPVQTAL